MSTFFRRSARPELAGAPLIISTDKPSGSSTSESTPGPPFEEKKHLLSHEFKDLFLWHLASIVSCIATVIILYLNFTEYIIGKEVGKNSKETRNYLTSLLWVAKVHELVIIASVRSIGQQWVQRCLIGDGMLLGLVGVEFFLTSTRNLYSEGLQAAIVYCFSRRPRFMFGKQGRDNRPRVGTVFPFVVFVYVAYFLCSTAAPASSVLMIPRQDWFFEGKVGKNLPVKSAHYPHILVDPHFGCGGGCEPVDYFKLQQKHWGWALYSQLPDTLSHNSSYFEKLYSYPDGGVQTHVHVTSSANRTLAADADWKGTTTFRSIMRNDIYVATERIADYQDTSKYANSPTSFGTDLTALETNTTCRGRLKRPCIDGNDTTTTGLEWCYEAVTKDKSTGQLLSSRNLLLLVDYQEGDDSTRGDLLPRFWMGEGPRMNTSKVFAESIDLIFGLPPNNNNTSELSLIVCSTSAKLATSYAESERKRFSPQRLWTRDSLDYFNGKSTDVSSPHKLVYHENWLDSLHQGFNDTSTVYPSRTGLNSTGNKSLKTWANQVLRSYGYGTEYWWHSDTLHSSATGAETIVGGSFLTALLRIEQSWSQYSHDDITQLTPDMVPEPAKNYTEYIYPPVFLYREVYGFQLSSRTDYFSATVLIMHAVVVLLGSLWHLWKGSIIMGWNTVPEYVTLGIGSEGGRVEIENTCVAIEKKETLMTPVRVRQVSLEEEHLGVIIGVEDGVSTSYSEETLYGCATSMRRVDYKSG